MVGMAGYRAVGTPVGSIRGDATSPALKRLRWPFAVSALVAAVMCAPSFAAPAAAPPNFAPSNTVGWIAQGAEFLAPPSGPGPVMNDPAHPRISNAVALTTGTQPTFHIGDANSPILQPWAREEMRKRNAQILAGKPGYTRQVSCWPVGVPTFLLYPVQPIYIVQGPKEVLMISQEDHMVRHVYMDQPHSTHVKPSWYGESVGHYEGDTLVVDTIGLSPKAVIDNYHTPHTDQLHVVERYHLINGGKQLEANLLIEDPGTFNAPWQAQQHYTKVPNRAFIEQNCSENNDNIFNLPGWVGAPTADKPDF